jgi:hypothetical protein
MPQQRQRQPDDGNGQRADDAAPRRLGRRGSCDGLGGGERFVWLS